MIINVSSSFAWLVVLLITAPVRCSARVQQLDQQHSLLLRIPDDDDGSSVIKNNYSAFFSGGIVADLLP